jgi:L-ascorbate metabolism protein UlaG (beta-lactamase superfamily)
MNVTWLGQSGYLLEGGGARIAIDPYLSDAVERAQGLKRLIAPPLTVSQLAPDHLLITHDHLDHFDPDTVSAAMKAFPACRLAGPASVMAHGARIGIAAARLVPLDTGAAVRLGDVEVAATPARHSDGSAVGLLVRSADALLWFSGDTLYVPEMAAQILRRAGRPPDAAFVCMNGRLGNMGVDDAVRLVAELRPAIAVPSHYGMFAENTADPAAFVDACARAGLRAVVLEPGRSRTFPGDR